MARPLLCRAAAAAFLLALSGPLSAAPATPEGAAGITAEVRRYLGPLPGLVSIEPQGEDYLLTVDLNPLAARLLELIPETTAEVKPEVEITPITMALTDRGDGTWRVRQDSVLQWRYAVPGLVEGQRSSRMVFDGIFDPALRSFTEATTTETDSRQTERNFGLTDEPVSETEATIAEVTSHATARANPAGGVDSTAQTQARDLLTRQKIFYSAPDATGRRDTFAIEAGIARYGIDAAGTGLRMVELAALTEFLVALPSLEALPQRQDELKPLLRAALPLFEEVRISGPIEGLRVVTGIMRGGFGRIDTALDLSGLVRDGRLRFALALAEPDLPVMMLDPWMRPLVPQSASVDVTISGVDAAAGAAMVIDALDLRADEPLGTLDQTAFAAAVLPQGGPRIDLAPGLISAPEWSVAYGGWLQTGPPDAAGVPALSGEIRIEATGLDTVEAQIAAAPGRRAAEALAMLQDLRRHARQEDGRDLWLLDSAKLRTMSKDGAGTGDNP